MSTRSVRPSPGLANVRYEIRGKLARRAQEMERMGYDIVSLNIGNPGAFGFRTPETMRLAMIENLRAAEGYCHQKGIFPAREAVVMQQQERGVRGVTADDVFIGNGVSELIDLTLRALLAADEEVLVPSPDYPLWTAAVNLNRGRGRPLSVPPGARLRAGPGRNRIADHEAHARHRRDQPEQSRPAPSTRGKCSRRIARIAEKHHLVIFADEIYDQMTYDGAEFVPMATLVHHTLCCTMSGLSKVYRACGYRVGWAVFSGDLENARDYLSGARTAVVAAALQQRRRASGPCRRRSAATRASRNWSAPADACTSPARPSWTRWRAASTSRSRCRAARCTPS